jgi:site-specific DNA-methyltransferase (adenine-specific)
MTDKHHVTGKPTAVMRRLARICPPDGVVLDPFAGSGTTGVAALLEGRTFLGVEVAREYARIASDRLGAAGSEVQLADYRAGQQPLFPRSQVVGS